MRRNDESGSALITAMLVIVVVGMLGAASATLADRNTRTSARSRERVAATHAAEAGIHRAMAELRKTTGAAWCGVGTTPLPGSSAPGSQAYSVEVLVPGPTGDPVPCATASAADRARPTRIIRSTGVDPGGAANGAPTRVMEAQVELEAAATTPSGGISFDDAIFSGTGSSLGIASGITINGDGADDADVYSGFTGTADARLGGASKYHGDVVVRNGLRIEGSVVVHGDVVAGGDIEMSGGTRVTGSLTSATGSVSLSGSARVDGTARAAGSVTTSGGASIAVRQPGSPSAPPPARELPQPPASFPAAGWPQPYRTFATCAAFDDHFAGWYPEEPTRTNRANFVGTYHVLQSGCAAELPNSQPLTMTGPAAIVTEGCFLAQGSARITRTAAATAAGDQLLVVSLAPNGCGSGNGGVKVNGGAMLESVPTLLYARNQVEVGGGAQIMGQIYGRSVDVYGGFHLHFRRITAGGFVGTAPAPTVEGFTPRLVYLREVNGT